MRRWSAVLAVLVLAACAEPRSAWQGRVLRTGGSICVENPATPLAGPDAVTASPLWRRTGPERGDIWEVPNRVHVLGGVVFVVDRAASRIHRVGTDGALLGSLGEPGPGPGQYRRIADAVPTEAGLFVVDVGNGRLEVLSDSGEIRSTAALGRLVYTAAPLEADAIALLGLSGDTLGWTRIDAAGARTPLAFPDFETPADDEGPVSSGTTWNGRLVRLRYTTPTVRIYNRSGILEREIVIPLPVEEATDEEVETVIRDATTALLRDGLPSEAIEQAATSIRAWPRQKRRFRKIEFDEGTGLAGIWEQNPEDFGSGNATLHLLTVGGVYLAALEFDRAWSDFDLDAGVLYCLSRDPETDLVTLAAWTLKVPQDVLGRARAALAAEAGNRP